jgi:hypothetical protein
MIPSKSCSAKHAMTGRRVKVKQNAADYLASAVAEGTLEKTVMLEVGSNQDDDRKIIVI